MTPFRKYILPLTYLLLLAAAFFRLGFGNSVGPEKAQVKGEAALEIQRVETAELPDYKRPAYFSIFKFIVSFLPASQR